MKKIFIIKAALFFTLSLAPCIAAFAQTSFQSQVVDIRLSGTSNLHDWEMKAVKGSSNASFAVDARGKITSLASLSFTLPAKNLKSGHSQMDKNTYKALMTDNNPNISFVMTSGKITPKEVNTYQVNCRGKMTIAGATKQTDLVATGTYNPADKSLTITGVKKMKMTDYNVKPPTALAGTIKTGDDISISYSLKMNR